MKVKSPCKAYWLTAKQTYNLFRSMKQSRSHFTKNMIFSHHVLMKKLHLMPAKKLHEQLKTEKLVNE